MSTSILNRTSQKRCLDPDDRKAQPLPNIRMKNRNHEIEEAIRAGEAAMEAVSLVVKPLTRATQFAKADYWSPPLVVAIPKYCLYLLAKWRGRAAQNAIDDFQIALQSIDMEHQAQIEMGLSARDVLLDVLDTGVGELFLAGNLASNRTKANITLSRVRRVVRTLKNPEQAEALDAVEVTS
ncbi:MAG: hypothetical protein ACI9K5_003787 [Gammaproteobacteria bacterium]